MISPKSSSLLSNKIDNAILPDKSRFFGSFWFVRWYNKPKESLGGVSMYRILSKKIMTPTVSQIEIEAPLITRHAQPGQFIMLRVDEKGERLPFTLADINRNTGTIAIIFQVVGASTYQLNQLQPGDELTDLVGPLGKPSELEGLRKVLVIGGGLGCAIAYPLVKELSEKQAIVHSIIGFRTKELVFMVQDFQEKSQRFSLLTDDGSLGDQGLVTETLERWLNEGETYDAIYAIGPLPMMKAVANVTRPTGMKTIVSMNPIMVDGTGMCGGCRVKVDGKVRFACVDGPEFDGHAVDFDDAILRNRMYAEMEKKQYDHVCRLKKERSQ